MLVLVLCSLRGSRAQSQGAAGAGQLVAQLPALLQPPATEELPPTPATELPLPPGAATLPRCSILRVLLLETNTTFFVQALRAAGMTTSVVSRGSGVHGGLAGTLVVPSRTNPRISCAGRWMTQRSSARCGPPLPCWLLLPLLLPAASHWHADAGPADLPQVLVPNDAAWVGLLGALNWTKDQLLADSDRAALREVLEYHIIPGPALSVAMIHGKSYLTRCGAPTPPQDPGLPVLPAAGGGVEGAARRLRHARCPLALLLCLTAGGVAPRPCSLPTLYGQPVFTAGSGVGPPLFAATSRQIAQVTVGDIPSCSQGAVIQIIDAVLEPDPAWQADGTDGPLSGVVLEPAATPEAPANTSGSSAAALPQLTPISGPGTAAPQPAATPAVEQQATPVVPGPGTSSAAAGGSPAATPEMSAGGDAGMPGGGPPTPSVQLFTG